MFVTFVVKNTNILSEINNFIEPFVINTLKI